MNKMLNKTDAYESIFGRTSLMTAFLLLSTTALTIPLTSTGSYAADLEEIPVVEEAEKENDPLTLFDGRLKIGLGAAQHFNAIQADAGAFNGAIDENTAPGFERLRFNLELTFNITDNIFAFVDIAEEPNDFRGLDPFSLNQDFGFIDLNLTGLAGKTSGPELHLRLGNIGVGTFDGFHSFSDGSVVQGNPLIGNSPATFGTAQSGGQFVASITPSGIIKSASADFAVTIPSFGGESTPGRGFNILTGAGFETDFGLGFSTRFFGGQGGDQLTENGLTQNGAGVFLADPDVNVQQDGIFFGDGDNFLLAGSDSSRIFHQGLTPGLDAFILQFNLQYKPTFSKGTQLRTWGGIAGSDFSFADAAGNQTVQTDPDFVGFSEQDSSINFIGVELQQYILPEKVYVAGRYTRVDNTTSGVDGGALTRFQVGGGWFIDERTLWKVEYVNQDEDENSPGQIGTGFQGVVSELSVRF